MTETNRIEYKRELTSELHHGQGRYKQIENSSCRTEIYNKVASKTNRSRPCYCL